MTEYEKYYPEIENICKEYGFTKCERCPLYSACQTERKDEETQGEYAERWETAIVQAYKKE